MIPIHEAQKKLIEAGYEVPHRPVYKNLTILNATYNDVKEFLRGAGYNGDIIVIGRIRDGTHQKQMEESEGVQTYPTAIQTQNRAADEAHRSLGEHNVEYEQLSFF